MTGSLTIAIDGLPAGAAAAIGVSSAQGYQHTVNGPQTLSGLPSGSYAIVAGDVQVDGDRYVPSPAAQNVSVAAGTPVVAAIAYVLVTAHLQITLGGLPAGTTAEVTVSGPAGYQHTVTSSETLTGLAPGTYAILAPAVDVNGDQYKAQPDSWEVPLAAGTVAVPVAINYALATGRLALVVSGVPAGGVAAISVSGPGGFAQSFSTSQLLTGLAPGLYTISAANLSAGGQLYLPAPPLQSATISASLVPQSVTVSYAVSLGSIAVTVAGLPAGVGASLSVSGPGGYAASLSQSQTLTGLVAGSYSITAASVTSGGVTYVALPAQQDVVLSGGGAAAAQVTYSVATGSLALTISGVPSGATPSVSVTGPGGFAQNVSASQILTGLTPGVYTITAASLMSGGYNYAPAPPSQTKTVSAGTTASASVNYAATTGALSVAISGLPGGASANVSVSGPGGFSQNLTGSQTLSGLAPGSYTVSAAAVSSGGTSYTPAPPLQTPPVSAGATASVSVSYSASGGSGLDLLIDGAYLTQATQRYDGSVPLVAGRDAYLRVFALANQANSSQPQVRVRLYNGASLLQTYTLAAPSASVPTSVDESSLTKSWNVLVPAALVQPGLRLLADVDPANGLAESDESNNQFPLSGTPATVDVRALPVFALRFVPVFQQVNGLQGNVNAGNQNSFLADLRKMLPVGASDVDLRAPYTTTAPVLQSGNGNGAWGTILSEILALRTADASSRYYYGVVRVTYGSGVAGMGYVGGSARSAIGWDYLPSGTNVMAHEVGHNMGRLHAPCGGPAGPDPSYPYPGGQIGVWGLDLAGLALKTPTTADVMGYCGPNWISDYNWSAMLAYRESGPNNAPDDGSAGSGLLIWGRITAAGVVLEPAFRVPAASALLPRAGSNRLELLAADGSLLRSVAFEAAEIADLPGGPERHFAFVLPLGADLQASLSALRVTAAGRSAVRSAPPAGSDPAVTVSRLAPAQIEVRWDAIRFPMVMVRDAASGQILSFARGGVARLWASGRDFDLQFSDGVRTTSRARQVLR